MHLVIMEWNLEQNEFTNSATHGQTEVWMDRDNGYLGVMAEQGSGCCMQQNIATRIPMETIVAMMRHIGYRVDAPLTPEAKDQG